MRKHLTYANVMSTLAVFMLLGGVAFAAKGMIGSKDIKKNAVKSKHLKNGQVKSKDIQDGKGVKGKDIKDGSVGGSKLSGDSVDGSKIADGSVTGDDLAPPEDVFTIGAPGSPGYEDGGEGDCIWTDAAGEFGIDYGPAAYWRDRDGVVHLEGALKAANGPAGDMTCDSLPDADSVAFVLPEEYWPPSTQLFIGVSGQVIVFGPVSVGDIPPGAVVAAGIGGEILSGMTYRTGERQEDPITMRGGSGSALDSGSPLNLGG